MINLIHAGIYRYQKDGLFWFGMGGSLLAGGIFGITSRTAFDDIYLMPELLILCAFVTLSIGREYSENTIRNKVVTGHTKGNIFLSSLLLSVGACTLRLLVFLGIFAVLNIGTLGAFTPEVLGKIFLGFLLLNVAQAVIFAVVSWLIPSRAVGAVVCMILMVGMMMAYYQVEHSLGQPEYITIDHIDEDGDPVVQEVIPNSNYLDGSLRKVCQGIYDVLPYSQANQYLYYMIDFQFSKFQQMYYETDEIAGRLNYLPLCSLALIVTFSSGGFLIFRRKELK